MRKIFKKTIAIGLAAALSVAAVAGTAFAYFTDQVRASGEASVNFGYDFSTDEGIDSNGNKNVTIKNTGETDLLVRVYVFGAGIDDAEGKTSIEPGSGWTNDPTSDVACYTYNKVLAPGDSTAEPLKVTVNATDDQGDFEVTVVSQASPVAYDAQGRAYGALWAGDAGDTAAANAANAGQSE